MNNWDPQENNKQKKQQKQSLILDSILNNTNCFLNYNNRDYILLIKKQKNKDYCTLFITDCSDNFWIEKLDSNYCSNLKQDMNVKTKTELFAKHFVQSLKNNPTIQTITPNLTLKLHMKISEALIINCPVTLSICINSEQNPEEYKKLIRSFFKQLYEAKESQIEEIKKQLINQKQDKVNIEYSSKDYIKSAFNIPQKYEVQHPSSKNRDLINPLKKKRKNEGMKLTGFD